MKTLAIIILGIILSASSCRDKYPGEPIALRNNSDKRIYYWYPYWKSGKNWIDYCYPDTLIPEKRIGLQSIAPHNSVGIGEDDPDYVTIFSKIPSRKFSVYFFDNYYKTQQEWDSIRDNRLYYRKDVTLQELIDNKYRICYP
jgi:hypothetical protein